MTTPTNKYQDNREVEESRWLDFPIASPAHPITMQYCTFVGQKGSDNRIEYVRFNYTDGATEARIGSQNQFDFDNGKASVRAYLDVLVHGLFDHQYTDFETGMAFIRRDAQMDAFYSSGIGFVFHGHQLPGFPRVNGLMAEVNRVNGQFKLSSVASSKEENADRYCTWLQSAVVGNAIRVRTLPYTAWIEAVMDNLRIQDPVARLANYKELKAAAGERARDYRDNRDSVESGDIPTGPITLKVWGTDDTVSTADLKYGQVKIMKKHGSETTIWDGSDSALVVLRNAAEKGYEVRLN